MFPWLWLWAPQIHGPFSGAVTQDIAPETFFGAIPPAAGDGRIERRAFELASYGRQLGWLTEALLAQAGRTQAVGAEQGAAALDKLERLHGRIDALKRARHADLEAEADAALARLARADRTAFERVLARQRVSAAGATPPALPAPRRRRAAA